MNQDRLVELVMLVSEDRASDAERAELADEASSNAQSARLLACHLAIDDILSQLSAPERGANAFLAGFRERVRISGDGDAFSERVMAAIDRERPWRRRLGDWGLRAGGLAAAAVLAVGLLSFLLLGTHAGQPRSPTAVDGVTALLQQSNPSLHGVYELYPRLVLRPPPQQSNHSLHGVYEDDLEHAQ